MSWFCQKITEEGRLCWLPKGHDPEKCQAAPMEDYPLPPQGDTFTASYQIGDPSQNLFNVKLQVPVVLADGSLQLPLPGM